jgi:hypothetical protein
MERVNPPRPGDPDCASVFAQENLISSLLHEFNARKITLLVFR